MSRRPDIKRVFLVGCPRSGTTLLQSFLASHSQVKSFPESHFFSRLRAGRPLLRRLGLASRRATPTLEAFLREAEMGHHRARFPRRALFARQLARRFIALLDEQTRDSRKTAWLEKTPDHLLHIGTIERYVDGARYIHIVRNGADVVASLYDVTHRFPQNWGGAWGLETCIAHWNRAMEATAAYQFDPRHSIVRYEDVADHPEVVMEALCKSIGLPFEAGMLEKREATLSGIITSSEPWKRNVGQQIQRSQSKAAELFSPEQQQFVQDRLVDARSLNCLRVDLP